MINQLHELIKEAGFGATIVLGQPRVNVYNDKSELIGQFIIHGQNQIWFTVFDTTLGELSPAGEGGACDLDSVAIKDIINEFRYR